MATTEVKNTIFFIFNTCNSLKPFKKFKILFFNRQCMCCYTDLKNFTKINHVIQKIIGYSIQLTNNLLWDDTTPQTEDDEVDVTGLEKKPESSSSSADVKELVCVQFFSVT